MTLKPHKDMQKLISRIILAFAFSPLLRSISHGNLKISFLLRPPLYLFCVSDHLEPSYVLRTHLEYLYMQILSTTTRSSLLSVFAKRSNFDLRRLIEGTEGFLRRLIRSLQDDFSMLTSSLQPLRLDPAIRTATANALLPSTKEKVSKRR